eukprot:CAMPEP_0175208204 /NCGR_PEP_ID=MMETSP0093-20121207/13504_1 /TAXON_ID=311494 /ORGANISM="Alexandrium monilatum, Strain CCMP3105" /LENGTH=47 /DNA_ID= /DNA_START= /DNA_END= /DNA_ORIENTATION=
MRLAHVQTQTPARAHVLSSVGKPNYTENNQVQAHLQAHTPPGPGPAQ